MLIKKKWIKENYKANILAQTICLIINCAIFYTSQDYLLIWVESCALNFIGIVTSQPKSRIIDINLVNHFLLVFIYYLLAAITLNSHSGYLVLLFVFTYVFFILKDSGFEKSITTWTFIQCLLFATTLTSLKVELKLYGALLGYLEAQVVLWLSFKIFKSPDIYVKENRLFSYRTLKSINWFNINQMKVKLAIRGSLVAGILYVLCLLNSKDAKPNWAVIAAISCLMRNDNVASRRIIVAIFFGSGIGFVISWLLLSLNVKYDELLVILLWLMLVVVIICIFEFRITMSIYTQIIGVVAVTVAITCLYFILDFDSKFYLQLRVINNLLGIGAATGTYLIWKYIFKYDDKA